MAIRLLTRFLRQRDGNSAVEFALVVPFLLSLYFGTVELCDGLVAHRKATSLASIAADLIAQDTSITNSEMNDIFAALDSVVFPYQASRAAVVVTSVTRTGNQSPRVAWSEGHNAPARSPGTTVNVPTALITSGGSVIMAETTFTYSSPAGQLIYGDIVFTDTFYLRPRRSLQVARAN